MKHSFIREIIYIAAGLFASAVLLAGCALGVSEPDFASAGSQAASTGSATMRIHLLDYAALTGDAGTNGARAIAPQTAFAKLSRYDASGRAWVAVQQLSVEADDLAELTDADTSAVLPVSRTGTLTFTGIPVGTYAKGTLKIDLSETADGAVISSGTNEGAVTIAKETPASASFYTVPKSAVNITATTVSGSVASGKMAFYSIDHAGNEDFYVTAVKTGGSGEPDAYVFNFTGYLVYYDDYPDSGSLEIPLVSPSDVDTVIFVGMYADGGDVQFEITHSSTIPVGPGPTGRGEGSIAAPIELVPGTAKAASIVFDDDDYNTDDYSYYKFTVAAAGKYVISASNLAGPASPYAWVNLYSNADFESGNIQLSSGAFSSSTSALPVVLPSAGTYYLKIRQNDTSTNFTFNLLVSVAPPEWVQTASLSTPNKVGVLALDAEGVPYVLYTETDTSNFSTKLSVKKEGSSGWDAVGLAKFSNAVNTTCGMAMDISSSGKVAAAYGGGTSDLNKALQVFEFDGTSWSQLGGDIIPSTDLVYGFEVKLEYAADGGLYLFCASKSSGKELYVRKWSSASSVWVKVGDETTAYAARNQSGSWYDYYTWGLDESGNPVLVLEDFSSITLKTASSGTWSNTAIDSASATGGLKWIDGTLVSVIQSTETGTPVTISALFPDAGWTVLGSAFPNVTNYKQKSVVAGDELYFAYHDSSTYTFVVKKLNGTFTQWDTVVTEMMPTVDDAFTFAVTDNGKMYLAFFPSGTAVDYKVYSYTPAE